MAARLRNLWTKKSWRSWQLGGLNMWARTAWRALTFYGLAARAVEKSAYDTG